MILATNYRFYNFLIFHSIRFLQRWTDVKQFERLLNPKIQISAIKNWQDILIIFGKLLSFQGQEYVMQKLNSMKESERRVDL